MTITDGNIVNDSNSKKFLFRTLSPLKNKKSQPAIAIPLVNRSGTANVLFRFQGQTEEVTFSFGIFNDGTDVSDGTNATTIISVQEQIEYLRDGVYTSDFEDTWTLTQSRYYPNGVVGVITSLEFDNPAGAGTVVTGNFTFKPGKIGNI